MDFMKDEQVVDKFVDDFERFSSGKKAKQSKKRFSKNEFIYMIFKLKKTKSKKMSGVII